MGGRTADERCGCGYMVNALWHSFGQKTEFILFILYIESIDQKNVIGVLAKTFPIREKQQEKSRFFALWRGKRKGLGLLLLQIQVFLYNLDSLKSIISLCMTVNYFAVRTAFYTHLFAKIASPIQGCDLPRKIA